MTNTQPASLDLISHAPEETSQWAEALSDLAQPGLTICLWGDVGAGKTFFARSLIQHLQALHGQPEDVPSPTFTLVQTYDAGPLEIWHADLYRLSTPTEVEELGLTAAFETALCLIEWPDRLGDLTPADALHLTFTHADDAEARACKITCSNAQTLTRCRDLLRMPS